MKERKNIWSIIVLAMFVLVMLYMVKTCNGGRRLSEVDVEQQYSRDVSMSVTGAPILPLKGSEINLTNADIRQNHLQVNNQSELSNDSENIAYSQVCASEWLDDGITVQEMLLCIEGDTGGTNGWQVD
ncbi:MAG: hypothetical protein KAV87_25445 [Desulfobacteraceae bacterium]|nr:hypothetical protein [Desulfobacteraceae bacterium]